MSFGNHKPNQIQIGNIRSTGPTVGVHVLAQIEFCRRAGILSSEEAAEDTGDENETLQRLDYLPDYEEAIIRERLTSSMQQFWLATIIIGAGVIAVWLVAMRDMGFGILCSLPLAGALFWWIGIARVIVILRHRLDAAIAAVPNEPNLTHLSEQVFNWWDLRKAGYQVDRLPEPMIDRSYGLAGRPWRVLRKGGLRIPVFRKHRGDRSIHSQHRVRIAAYCHLIEACEGSSAPFGLVMFAGSYDVVVIPNNSANQSAFANALQLARELLGGSSGREDRSLIPAPSACFSCPLGLPRLAEASDQATADGVSPPPVNAATGVGGREFHSRCGDRFAWIPPHARAKSLRLSE
jgi:hypothetical protein